MKTFIIKFSDFAKESSLRFDVDFLYFQIQQEKKPSYLFKDLFKVESFEKKDRMKLLEKIGGDDFYYSEIGNATKQGDVEPVKLNFNDRNELVEDYFKKIEKGDIQKVEENNILLAKVRPNLKKYIFVNEEKKDYFYTTTIKNISKEIFAGGDKPKNIVDEKDDFYGIPVYSNGKESNGLQGFSNKVRVKEKSVTISARGTIGYAVFRDEKYFPIVRLITIIFDENKILGKYLEHAINFLNLEKSGNTIAQLTVPMAKKIKIPLPDLDNQQKIVDEIKEELDKQEEIKKQIEKLRNEIDEIVEKSLVSI